MIWLMHDLMESLLPLHATRIGAEYGDREQSAVTAKPQQQQTPASNDDEQGEQKAA